MSFFIGQLSQRLTGTEISFYSPILIETDIELLSRHCPPIDMDYLINQAIADDSDYDFLRNEDSEVIFSVSIQHKVENPLHLEGINLTYPHKLSI